MKWEHFLLILRFDSFLGTDKSASYILPCSLLYKQPDLYHRLNDPSLVLSMPPKLWKGCSSVKNNHIIHLFLYVEEKRFLSYSVLMSLPLCLSPSLTYIASTEPLSMVHIQRTVLTEASIQGGRTLSAPVARAAHGGCYRHYRCSMHLSWPQTHEVPFGFVSWRSEPSFNHDRSRLAVVLQNVFRLRKSIESRTSTRHPPPSTF